MEKGKKASKYLREGREIINNCCSKLIKAEGAIDHFSLAMQDRLDSKMSDKEERDIELEIDKMTGLVETLVETAQSLERKWLRGQHKRTKKGRRDHSANDSGIMSIDSSVLPQGPEPSTIIAQPTLDLTGKTASDGVDISLSGPAALSGSSIITEETDDHKKDATFSEIAPTTADAHGCATGTTKDTEYYSRHPLEHEDTNSLVRDNETCKDASLDNCDKLDPDSIETVYERKTENNEKTEHGESGHHETPSVQPAPDLPDANLRATNIGQQVPTAEPVRESAAFATNLGEDGLFLQTQGNHQKLRHKCSKNKSNSL